MSKVTVVARSQAKPGKEDEVQREFLHLVAETRKEEGCINYDLHQADDDKSVFMFYENWVSRGHLDRHAQSVHIAAFRAKSRELLTGPTQITLWEMLSDAR